MPTMSLGATPPWFLHTSRAGDSLSSLGVPPLQATKGEEKGPPPNEAMSDPYGDGLGFYMPAQ